MDKRAPKRKRPMLYLSLLVIVFFVIELLFLDDIIRVEGIRIGLYNAFIVYALMESKMKMALGLFFVKLVTSLFAVSMLLLFPICGGVLSITAMILAKKVLDKKAGYLGIGIIGALTYNISVYVLASISLKSSAVFYNIPSVLFLSVLLGAITGCIGYLVSKTKLIPVENGGNNETT
jgi:uncharacterized membrane protein